MQREPIEKSKDGKTRYRDEIMESAKELSEDSAVDPDTCDLQTDEERYTETRTEVRNGIEITLRRKGVRPRAVPAAKVGQITSGPEVMQGQPDLNTLPDADLETLAAKVGCVNYPKQQSKAKRVAAVREAMAAQK